MIFIDAAAAVYRFHSRELSVGEKGAVVSGDDSEGKIGILFQKDGIWCAVQSAYNGILRIICMEA